MRRSAQKTALRLEFEPDTFCSQNTQVLHQPQEVTCQCDIPTIVASQRHWPEAEIQGMHLYPKTKTRHCPFRTRPCFRSPNIGSQVVDQCCLRHGIGRTKHDQLKNKCPLVLQIPRSSHHPDKPRNFACRIPNHSSIPGPHVYISILCRVLHQNSLLSPWSAPLEWSDGPCSMFWS